VIVIRKDRCLLLNTAGVIKLAERLIWSYVIYEIQFRKSLGFSSKARSCLQTLLAVEIGRAHYVVEIRKPFRDGIGIVHLLTPQNNGHFHHIIGIVFLSLIVSSTSNPFPFLPESLQFSVLVFCKTERKNVLMTLTFGSIA
jgi:hypothetical protein